MIIQAVPAFRPSEYVVKLVTEQWERRDARRLRYEVFCEEQGLFVDDRDAIDAEAVAIVAVAYVGGAPDEVVGTVRIHEDRRGIWYGSRLAVRRGFRRDTHLGSLLIRLAVGTAVARGCHTFLAKVQQQNVPLFRRLHWRDVREMELHGRPHALMRADLAHYPPCPDGAAGLIALSRRAS